MIGRLWRYPVYVLAIAAVLMGSYWLFLLTAPNGWGGRTTIQIFLFATLLLIIPAGISLYFGFKAILAARERLARKAVISVTLAIGAVPAAWLITMFAHTRRMLPF